MNVFDLLWEMMVDFGLRLLIYLSKKIYIIANDYKINDKVYQITKNRKCFFNNCFDIQVKKHYAIMFTLESSIQKAKSIQSA